MEQRFAFNEEAALYEAARAGYPDALFDDIVSGIALTRGARLLEIGCGAGQATRSFAQIGYDILALDPGGELLARAREKLSGHAHVRFAQTTFEDWPLEAGAFDLVYAAQAFHWVAPEVRFVKAAAALAPHGALAVFGSTPVWLDDVLRRALQDVYERHATWGPPPEIWYLPSGPVSGLFAGSGLFAPVTHKTYSWTRAFTTRGYVELLRTRSDHITMAPAQRERVLDGVAAAIDAAGGQFEMGYETNLYLARKRA